MTNELGRICDEAGQLSGVDYALFEGNARFITAVVLRFEALTAVFRAVADDDTLAVVIGAFRPEPGEVLRAASLTPAWANCLRREVCWAWRLRNQQGYDDGIRLEFGTPGEATPRVTVELIVVASNIELFHATEIRPL